MKAEPLNIHDKRFLINRLIEQAPVSTLVREFFKNADESAASAAPGNRRIEIYPTKDNSSIWGGRTQSQKNFITRMKTHAGRPDDIL